MRRTIVTTNLIGDAIRALAASRPTLVRTGFYATASILLVQSQVIAAPARRQPAQRSMVVYPVKEGDTLSALAASYMLGPDAVQIVQRLNHIADPRRIPIGLKLRVPLQMLRQDQILATVHSFSGPVTIASNGRTASATTGMRLGEGSLIQTGANAFISLDLPDGTVVTMPSQSNVSVGWLRRTALTGSIERRFDIKAGRVRAVVTPMTDPRSNFRVTTPVAVSAVRGTDFRVGYDPSADRATTEVLTGKVAVSNTKARGTLVMAGFGATEQRIAGVSAPIPLLPAPEPIDLVGRQRDPIVSFAVKPIAGAASYRLEVARDAGFVELVSELNSAEPRFALTDLPNGTYFSRISAIDAVGLEGKSEVYGFQRRLHGISASMESGGKRRYLFRWTNVGDGTYIHRFQLTRCDAAQIPVIDQANVANLGLVVNNLPAGTYCWRVQSIEVGGGTDDAVWSEINKFTITK
jgi:hypothetical protein